LKHLSQDVHREQQVDVRLRGGEAIFVDLEESSFLALSRYEPGESSLSVNAPLESVVATARI
jgi:hypothetical protein